MKIHLDYCVIFIIVATKSESRVFHGSNNVGGAQFFCADSKTILDRDFLNSMLLNLRDVGSAQYGGECAGAMSCFKKSMRCIPIVMLPR